MDHPDKLGDDEKMGNDGLPAGFRSHEIGGIIALVEEHRFAFLEAWNGYFSQGR